MPVRNPRKRKEKSSCKKGGACKCRGKCKKAAKSCGCSGKKGVSGKNKIINNVTASAGGGSAYPGGGRNGDGSGLMILNFDIPTRDGSAQDPILPSGNDQRDSQNSQAKIFGGKVSKQDPTKALLNKMLRTKLIAHKYPARFMDLHRPDYKPKPFPASFTKPLSTAPISLLSSMNPSYGVKLNNNEDNFFKKDYPEHKHVSPYNLKASSGVSSMTASPQLGVDQRISELEGDTQTTGSLPASIMNYTVSGISDVSSSHQSRTSEREAANDRNVPRHTRFPQSTHTRFPDILTPPSKTSKSERPPVRSTSEPGRTFYQKHPLKFGPPV